MKLFSVAVIGLMSIVSLSLPADVSAASNPFDIGSRLERVQNRISEINERFEKRLEEVGERVEQNQQRVCERLGSISTRDLPPFCGDEPEPEEPTLDFTASPEEITEGGTSTLTWDSENTDSCEASDGWSGDKDTEGSMEVSPTETTTYTLTCTGEGGEVEESATVTVNPVDPGPDAPTLNFTATPETIDEGSSSTLNWSTTDADTCEGSDGWTGNVATNGSEVVTPSATTMYTLTCVGEGGTTTDSVTVTINPVDPGPDAPTLNLGADPMSIEDGSTSTLSWSTTDADTCTASDGWTGDKSTNGSEVVDPATTTTYTLECVGEGGTTTESVMVTVTEEPEPDAPTLSFSASPLEVLSGGTSTLTWDSENTDGCEAENGWSGTKSVDGSEEVTVNATTTYELTCVGEGGTTTESVTVNVIEEDEGPVADHLVISEVFYDVDDAHGSETLNEWVELHNPTESTIDVMDWVIGESTTTGEVVATTSLEIPAGGYLVITNATNTADFWNFTGVSVVYLGTAINSGFANGGDYVGLFDTNEVAVDEVSYGTNEDSFSPSVPSVAEGSSIARVPVTTDTDSANDWEESVTPTPGS